MEFQTFGNYLENFRISKNISRSQLCNGICSEKQLYRIEKSESEPSIYILNQLSLRLNTDLLELYKHYNINSTNGFKEMCIINDYLHNNDIRSLKKYLNSLNSNEFLSNSFFLETYYYAYACCFYQLDNDYNSSLLYIDKGLRIDHNILDGENPNNAIFSNHGYCLLNLKASILLRQKEYIKALHLLHAIRTSLETNFIVPKISAYLTPMFIHKIYTAVLSNIVMIYYYLAEYESVIAYSDIAITYSMKNYILRHFQIILDYRGRALYHLGEIKEANKLFNTAIALYEMDNGYEDYIRNLKATISKDFPLVNII